MQKNHLSDEQKRYFFNDGFIVIKNIVPRSYTKAAKALIEGVLPRDKRVLLVPRELATHPDILRLFNQTRLKKILETELGPFPEVISSQVAVTPALDAMGGRPSPHVDGSWSRTSAKTMSGAAATMASCGKILTGPYPSVVTQR